MDTTVSYWIHDRRNPRAEPAKLLDAHGVREGVPAIAIFEVAGFHGIMQLTDDFAERYDVIRRVSAPKPTPDALSYVVTFVNHDYVTPGGRHPEHQVELWSRELLDADDVILEDMAWGAAEVWPEAGWANDSMAWWLAHVTLPDGTQLRP